MATLLIGYDLNKTKDYPALYEANKGLGVPGGMTLTRRGSSRVR